MIWGGTERSRIRVMQIDNLRSLQGIKRIDRVPNELIRKLRGVAKGVDEKTDERVLCWFGHIERIEKYKITKRMYVGEFVGSCLVGRSRKRWIDFVNDCLKNRDLNFGKTRRTFYDTNEWREFVRGNALGNARGMNP